MSSAGILPAIISPINLKDFWKFWPDKPVVAHGDLNRLPDIFRSETLHSLENILTSYEGDIILNKGSATKFTFQTKVKKSEALPLIDMGFVLQFTETAQLLPNSIGFRQALASDLGISWKQLKMAVFASAKVDKEGLGWHFDGYDVLVVQVRGTKNFQFAPGPVKYHCGYQLSTNVLLHESHYPALAALDAPVKNPKKYKTISMRPGTVLFLPRGYWHKTSASSDSISVNIIIDAPITTDVIVENMRKILSQVPVWRKPLYRMAAQSKQLRGLLDKLPKIVKAMNADDAIADYEGDKSSPGQIRNNTRILKIPGISFTIKNRDDDKIDVTLNKRKLRPKSASEWKSSSFRIHERAAPILRWLEKRRRTTFEFREIKSAFGDFDSKDLASLLLLLDEQRAVKLLFFARYPRI
jgi:ribosomal protein L16 Arg81 hydroxylase